MVWHIFRKDCKLVWPMAAGVGAINLADQLHGRLPQDYVLFDRAHVLLNLLPAMSLIATAWLIALVVFQDGLLGVRQDWLIRPIRRHHVLLAKLLFVVLVVQGPIFIGAISTGLLVGLPAGASIEAAFRRGALMFLEFDLLVLALATITRGLRQWIGAVVAVVLGFYVLFTALRDPYSGTALRIWAFEGLLLLWNAVGACVIVWLMYRWRKTVACWVFAAVWVGWAIASYVPVPAAFAVEERLSPHPEKAAAVRIAANLEPGGQPRIGTKEGERSFVGQNASEPAVFLSVTIRLEGIGDGRALVIDRMVEHWTMPGGEKISAEPVDWPPLMRQGSNDQTVEIPDHLFQRIRNTSVRLELEYWLTLIEAGAPREMPAVGGNAWLPGVGQCHSAVDGDITVACTSASDAWNTEWTLVNTQPELRVVKPILSWRPETPFDFSERLPSFSRASFDVPRAVLDQLHDARIEARVYSAQAYFTRSVVVPAIRLGDY